MDDLVDLIATDASANDVSDKIKDLLYAKSAERIEYAKPVVADSMFGDAEAEVETEVGDETTVDPEESNEDG
tara:strand:+ start:534 stop:749 length:216 start_codon:yes stop_codon:yes gene_type:complete